MSYQCFKLNAIDALLDCYKEHVDFILGTGGSMPCGVPGCESAINYDGASDLHTPGHSYIRFLYCCDEHRKIVESVFILCGAIKINQFTEG